MRSYDSLPERPRRAARAQAAPSPAALGLPLAAGNAALARALLARADALGNPGPEERLREAVAESDWAGAARVLLAADERWMIGRLSDLVPDQLRYLDDAVRRSGVKNSRLRIFVHARLEQLGASDDQAAPGGGYGTVETKLKPHDGELRKSGWHKEGGVQFEVWFRPNPAAVDADEIGFIQTARARSTAYSTTDVDGETDWQNEGSSGSGRQTADHTRVDRVPGNDYGWYGIETSGATSGHVKPWRRGAKAPAWMHDGPHRSRPNIDSDFETAVICRSGPDAGKVYATITWGYTIDAQMKIAPKDPVVFNKESPAFDLAVAFWNAEAQGDNSTGYDQHPLPENLR